MCCHILSIFFLFGYTISGKNDFFIPGVLTCDFFGEENWDMKGPNQVVPYREGSSCVCTFTHVWETKCTHSKCTLLQSKIIIKQVKFE